MEELATKYDPSAVEQKWYDFWMEHGLFRSTPDDREPYTIVIPPPNVTGVLHMGHMLNETIQDILVRRARMEGKNACWVPGTDHASIATEAKVVAKLASEGIKKTDLTREEFLRHAWDWTEHHGGIILKQLRRLGGGGQQGRSHGAGEKQGQDFFAFHAQFLRFHSMVGSLQTEPYHKERGKSNTIGRQRGDLTNSVIPARRSRTSGSPAGSSRRYRVSPGYPWWGRCRWNR